MTDSPLSNISNWKICCGRFPKQEIIYFTQVLAIYVIIIASLVNLSLSIEKNEIWISLLSICIGFLIPAPTIKDGRFLSDSTIQ